jgi:glucan phosphoethanolaminetransferase (alkaline phosphatase superfamily)
MKITKNIGEKDKKIRLFLGFLLLIASFGFSNILKWVFIVFGLVLIITALIGFCGIYTLFGINTCKYDKK